MCGIIGVLALHDVQSLLLDGLKHMEYRGYDSAGICVRNNGNLHCRKEIGKLIHLHDSLHQSTLSGHIGIGHTRWATHGAPTQKNAHPHLSNNVAVVHNGIIENHAALRTPLEAAGAVFQSQTDSEVIPWLMAAHMQHTDVAQAWFATISELEGAYALVAILKEDAPRLWFARRGSPLLLGRRAGSIYVASDALALAGLADEIMYLEEGDMGWCSLDGCEIKAMDGMMLVRDWQPVPPQRHDSADKGGFAHYMEKEIFEQPGIVANILQTYIQDGEITFPDAAFLNAATLPNRIVMVACGTSYHAALTARYWLERFLQVSVEVDVASEYRYRNPVIGSDTWLITLSQSGETADTLEALRLFKRETPDNPALSLCNVPQASIVRESDGSIALLAGPEVGVASTKAYTAQLTVLALLALKLAFEHDCMLETVFQAHLRCLRDVVPGMTRQLEQAEYISGFTHLFEEVHGALFLGRGPCFPLALEGALKLKEISYLHAEGYAAGEMKHGPIALIDSYLPVVVIAPQQYHLQKVLSNLREVQARGARIILLTDLPETDWPEDVNAVIGLPEGDYFSTPLLTAIPLQFIAYYVARSKGTDVDQPRNLAKSVTVE